MFSKIDENHCFIKDLENNWGIIKSEVDALNKSQYQTFEHSKDGGWNIMMFSVFGEINKAYAAA